MIWGGDPYSSKNWFFSNLVENYLKTREGWRLGTDLLKVSAELADLHRTFIFGTAEARAPNAVKLSPGYLDAYFSYPIKIKKCTQMPSNV